MALTPGSRLGPYEILQPIGAGGMGEIYRARHIKLRRQVAIKVLPTELASDPIRLSRLEREARSASALNHRNIVTIYDIAEAEGTTYLAMELVEGRTLGELISEGPLEIDRTIRLTSQIADGLACAHRAGIVHRDIKPANVIVTSDDYVKILDFGLAKPTTTNTQGIGDTSPTVVTGEGMMVGTPRYMSPEQFTGDTIDHRADQFALGILSYEMLTGRVPFDGSSLRSILRVRGSSPRPSSP